MNFDQLRKKIVEKAIRGQLVPQIQGEALSSKGPYEIPKTWRWVRLDDIATNIEYGTSVKCHDTFEDQDIPVIRMGNIKNGKLVLDDLKYAARSLIDFPKLSLRNGDIVFNRTNSRELVGKCAMFSGEENEFSFASYIIRARICEHQAYYISEYINSDLCRSTQILPFVTQQVGQANFNGTKLKNILIPLPPLEEQVQIVEKLKEAFTEIDRAEKAYEELQTLSEVLRSQILQKAIQGELVPQLNLEPAVDMRGDYPEEEPFEIPNKWKWVSLKEVATFNPKIIKDDALDVSFIPMAGVDAGYVNECETNQLKPWGQVKKSGFSRFEEGDVLLAKITPCFQNRKSCIARNLANETGAGSTEFHVMRCSEYLNPKYLLWFLKSEYFINYGVSHFSGTVGQQRFSTQEVKDCFIPLPPKQEQQRIIEKVDELMKQLDALGGITS